MGERYYKNTKLNIGDSVCFLANDNFYYEPWDEPWVDGVVVDICNIYCVCKEKKTDKLFKKVRYFWV